MLFDDFTIHVREIAPKACHSGFQIVHAGTSAPNERATLAIASSSVLTMSRLTQTACWAASMV
ncbi:hypothetical protein [Lamprobacter modestohalophilus]|uniref:hypothetical protein n=1 Tax=Lamprobacter modestohalophilus TaxID=1064514 RepID=UPI002ADEF464|nr:hypothetical protein [Lamprobacter modestohalophilus]